MAQNKLYQKYREIMPYGAGALFLTQIFSTMPFSVLYSTLILFATNKLKLNDLTATSITATFIAFNYTLHLLGGYIGGRYLSYRHLFSIGMIAITIGSILLSIPTMTTFYWGLASFLTGAGLNVTCINCMLTQLFDPHDKRRETAFLWNYSGMNFGFFIGFLISGYFQLKGNYHELFLLSSLGSFIALLLVIFNWKSLADINTLIIKLNYKEKILRNLQGFLIIIVLFILLRLFLNHPNFSNNIIIGIGILMAIVMVSLAIKQPSIEQRNKMWAYIILSLTALVALTLLQLTPMGLTLFIERNVYRNYFGLVLAPQWFQNINTLVVIIGGPILSLLFMKLRSHDKSISIPVQFCIALFLIGLSQAILPIGIYFANSQGYTNFNWLIGTSVLQTLGELFLVPIGYAMIGQLAPLNLQGIMMGSWMMLIGIAASLSGLFSKMAVGTMNSTNPLVTNPGFSYIFGFLGGSAIAVGIILILLLPLLKHLTQEKKLVARPQSVSTLPI